MSINRVLQQLLNVISLAGFLILGVAHADFAVLVDTAVLVEANPPLVESGEGEPIPPPPEVGAATNASYVSSGGWAVTGTLFIDATAVVFDFAAVTSVSSATLSLPIEVVYPQDGAAVLEIFFYADNGVVENTDYSTGFVLPIAEVDVVGLSQLDIDVTAAVNSTLSSSRFVGFRISSGTAPGAIEENLFPMWTGAKFFDTFSLEFTSGEPPAVADDTASFDGHTLEVPDLEAAGVGSASVQLRLIDPNASIYELTAAVITDPEGGGPSLSGIELFDCDAFQAPDVGDGSSAATYSINSGILDLPGVDFKGEQIAIRLEYIEGSNPCVNHP